MENARNLHSSHTNICRGNKKLRKKGKQRHKQYIGQHTKKDLNGAQNNTKRGAVHRNRDNGY